MRWGSLFSTLLLASASAAIPRLLSRTGGIDPNAMTNIVKELSAQRRVEARDEKIVGQLEAIMDGKTDDVPLQNLAAIQALTQKSAADLAKTQDLATGLAKAFRKQQPLSAIWKDQVLATSEDVRQNYRRHRERILSSLASASVALLVMAALGALAPMRGLALFLLTMAFELSGKWLLFASLATTAYFAASRLNPWPLFAPEIFAAPVGFMLLAGLLLRQLDPNYPLWNTMLKGFLGPVAACLGITGYVKYVPAA